MKSTSLGRRACGAAPRRAPRPALAQDTTQRHARVPGVADLLAQLPRVREEGERGRQGRVRDPGARRAGGDRHDGAAAARRATAWSTWCTRRARSMPRRCPSATRSSASTIDGPTARKNGGIELLNQIHQKRAGVWCCSAGSTAASASTSGRPRSRSSTRAAHIDIKGFKVRGNPIYNAFLTNYLGAQVINLPSTELYTALERGTVDITRLDADRPDGPELGPLHQVPHPAGLLLDRPDDPRQPEEVEVARRRRRARSCSASRSSTRPRACRTCRRCGRRRRPSSRSAASRPSRSRPRPRSASSPARAPRACSA